MNDQSAIAYRVDPIGQIPGPLGYTEFADTLDDAGSRAISQQSVERHAAAGQRQSARPLPARVLLSVDGSDAEDRA